MNWNMIGFIVVLVLGGAIVWQVRLMREHIKEVNEGIDEVHAKVKKKKIGVDVK